MQRAGTLDQLMSQDPSVELCVICLEPLEQFLTSSQPCGHTLHEHCSLRWRLASPAGGCPTCRHPMNLLLDKDLQDAALDYLGSVKDRAAHAYNDFLQVMKLFQRRQIDTRGAVQRVLSLFLGQADLIVGFNRFLPDGDKISEEEIAAAARGTMAAEAAASRSFLAPEQSVALNHAKSYVRRIRMRFSSSSYGQHQVYHQFLSLLSSYQQRCVDVQQVHKGVKLLFKDHPDLRDEFVRFLPQACHRPRTRSQTRLHEGSEDPNEDRRRTRARYQ